MFHRNLKGRHPSRGPGVLLWVVAGMAALGSPAAAIAQGPFSEPVMWVEEDWTLVIHHPDLDVFAPQLCTVMSPGGDLDGFYVQVTWNYREWPDFEAGGFQVQAWSGEELLEVQSVGIGEFTNSAETVTWTQVMATDGGDVGFAVLNGYSPGWGWFGGFGTAVFDQANVANLDGYSPDVSAQNTLVTYGLNRVRSLMISQVRYFGTNGTLLYTDSMPRVVYQMTAVE